MRVALIGAGRIGPLHARTLLSATDVSELVTMDLVPQRAVATAYDVGATSVATLEEAFDGADAVVVTTSTAAHPGLIRAALERGVPTFCEKPLATSLAESMALRAEIEAAGVPFQLGFQR